MLQNGVWCGRYFIVLKTEEGLGKMRKWKDEDLGNVKKKAEDLRMGESKIRILMICNEFNQSGDLSKATINMR